MAERIGDRVQWAGQGFAGVYLGRAAQLPVVGRVELRVAFSAWLRVFVAMTVHQVRTILR